MVSPFQSQILILLFPFRLQKPRKESPISITSFVILPEKKRPWATRTHSLANKKKAMGDFPWPHRFVLLEQSRHNTSRHGFPEEGDR
jgi:hypothetical protein